MLGEDHPSVPQTGQRLARVIAERERYEEAERLCREALAVDGGSRETITRLRSEPKIM